MYNHPHKMCVVVDNLCCINQAPCCLSYTLRVCHSSFVVCSKNVFGLPNTITISKRLKDCVVFYISKQGFIFCSNSVWTLLVAFDHLIKYLAEGDSLAVIAEDQKCMPQPLTAVEIFLGSQCALYWVTLVTVINDSVLTSPKHFGVVMKHVFLTDGRLL